MPNSSRARRRRSRLPAHQGVHPRKSRKRRCQNNRLQKLPRTPSSGSSIEHAFYEVPTLPLSTAQASRQGVAVGIVLVAQRPAVAKHHLHLGHLSPQLLRLLALPRSQREELPRLFRAPNQHERHSPWCLVQRPLDEASPPLDELLLASWPNQPLARAVGAACVLHPSSSFPTRLG